MDINHTYWEENSNIQHLKYESCNSNDGDHPRLKDEPLYRCCDSNLNFATVACSEDDSEYSQYKKNKVSRQDPMSHRIIEKRRRDRMNNCLADLSRLIPAEYLKKGRGRIEKTEIIEMAIRHIKYLQQTHRATGQEQLDQTHAHEQYRLGYQECMSETMRFLVEVEGYFAREALCVRLINHLQKHGDALLLRDAKPQLEKEFPPSSVPQTLLISPTTPNGTNMQQLQSPARQNSDQYDSGSHLRDMLAGNVKDEVRASLSPQIMNPGSRDAAFVRVPTPEADKPPAAEDFSQKLQEIHEGNTVVVSKPMNADRSRISENESCSNGVSLYKFKNNIKQRFSQDLNAETNQTKAFKRRKLASESVRRNSVTTETYSSENHSSPIDGSQYSPPSSEMCRVSSESETARISPTSSISDVRNSNRYGHYLKPENSINSRSVTNGCDRYSNSFPLKNNANIPQGGEDKANFSVPIFALHAKGSFYIPLTIDYHTLIPYLQHHNILDMLPTNIHNIILHPVTINVNFQSNYFSTNAAPVVKSSKHKNEGQNDWH